MLLRQWIYYNNLAIINSNFKKRDVIKVREKWFSLKYGKHVLRGILSMPWKRFIGFYNCHCPQPFLKETFKTVWNTNEEILNKTSSNKFRCQEDVSQYLFRYWQLCENKFIPRNTKFSKSITIIDDEKFACKTIQKQKVKVLCLNDNENINNEQFEIFKRNIINSFEKILPEKSLFEK